METPEGLKDALGKGLSGLLPAGHKAAITAEIFVRGAELGSVMALSIKQGIAVMLALAVIIIAIECAMRKAFGKVSKAPVIEPEKRKPRGLHRLASVAAAGSHWRFVRSQRRPGKRDGRIRGRDGGDI